MKVDPNLKKNYILLDLYQKATKTFLLMTPLKLSLYLTSKLISKPIKLSPCLRRFLET